MTGTLSSGSIHADEALDILPVGRPARVRGLHVHGATAAAVAAGQRAAVNLVDVPVAAVARGDALVTPGAFDTTRRVDVRLDSLPDAPPLRHGARVRVHHGTAEVMGRVALARVLDAPGDGPPSLLPPGARAYARLRIDAPIVAARGDRFVLRSYSPLRTIGGGVILDPAPRRGALRTVAARQRLEGLDPGAVGFDDRASLARALAALGGDARDGLRERDLAQRFGLDARAVKAAGESLVAEGRLLQLVDRRLDPQVGRRLCEELEALVAASPCSGARFRRAAARRGHATACGSLRRCSTGPSRPWRLRSAWSGASVSLSRGGRAMRLASRRGSWRASKRPSDPRA